MARRWLLVSIMLLIFVLVASCGIPQEEYDAVVEERDAAQTQVESLQDDLSEAQSKTLSLESDVSSLQSEVSSLQSVVSSLRSQVSSLTSDLATAERTIAELKAAAVEGTTRPTPIAALSKDYSKYGFGFDYTKGFSVTESGLFDSEANDNSGVVQVGIQDNGVQMFQVGWFNMTQSMWKASGGLHEALEETFEGMMIEGVESIDRGDLVETTKAGHDMAYQDYTMTAEGFKFYGIVAVFHCDESQRCYQLITMNTTISAKEDVLEDFMNYLDSFVCH